ncbi:MAG: magnesium protoporphyrin IX methyltransferase [Pseudomonadota bacterium]
MTQTFQAKKGQLETYFDRTASAAWAQLTSTEKVSKVRETVRAGRDRMRALLLAQLPADLTGKRVLDAGCGVGQLSVEAAKRGAEVIAVDIAPSLLEVAEARTPDALKGQIHYSAGDMLDPSLGLFDHVVAMDSLIHYRADDIAHALAALSERTQASMVFTVAPRTVMLTAMLAAGSVFPRGDRSPDIRPVSEARLNTALRSRGDMSDWRLRSHGRIKSGFYFSEAMEVAR